MKKNKKRNIIIGSLIIVLCICIGTGIYMYQNKSKLSYYHTEVSANNSTKVVKLYSDGNDVNLTFTNDSQPDIKLNGYFSPAALQRNRQEQKKGKNLVFDFIDNKKNSFINKHTDKQHTINISIPSSSNYKSKDISIVTNGGNVQIKNINSTNFKRNFDTNGGENKFTNKSQDSISKNTLTIKTNGGNITA